VADWPKLPEVRTLLRLQPDATEDAVIGTALASAIDYVNARTNYRWDPGVDPATWVTVMPDSIHQAAVLQAAHEYRRRDSLDGALGWGDQGVMRVGRTDPDVERILATRGPVVFG
jgi:hypothetical protein